MSTTTDNLDLDDLAPADRLSVGGLARNGAIAGAIKLASAGLSFLMFVVVALITDERQFGLFSAAYAGASLVSFFASVGQPSAIMRFWPQFAANGRPDVANSFMRRSIITALLGLVISSVAMVILGFVPWFTQRTPEWLPLCVSAATLSFALGWSDFASGAFRAKSALVSALLPRDVIWRGAVIVALLAMHTLHMVTDAAFAMMLTAVLLLLAVLPQAVVLLRDTIRLRKTPLTMEQKKEFNSVSLGLLGATSLPPALAQVSTLLVAAILGPEAAGAVFIADRTTRIVLLALNGLNSALAPEISSAFYGGDKQHVQKMTSFTALGALSVGIVTLLSFVFFGKEILAIFDPAYATPRTQAVLVIFGINAAVSTAVGPVEPLLQLTGLQHRMVKVLIVVNSIGLVVTAIATYEFGSLGAALGIAATGITWSLMALTVAIRQIGINPSVFGLVGLSGRNTP